MITFRYRTLMVFAAGFAVALIVVFAFQSWRADAAPGDNDTTFIPITPCRLLDTRPQTDYNVGPRSTPIGENSPVTFTAWDSGDDDSLCQIPSSAKAISTNTTIVNPTTRSFLKLYPADAALPGTSNLNYVAAQSATPNAVTIPLSPTGTFNVYNRFGTVHVIVDVNGYYTNSSLWALASENAALRADLTTLQSDVTALQALTASMSKETVDGQPTVRFSGVNVQVVDGTGDTAGTVNGKGNLIVGYNENASDTRTGSHNLIIGSYHAYISYGGLVAGYDNRIAGAYASVSGGQHNLAGGTYASVSGGRWNVATGDSASVSGGLFSNAEGNSSSVSGGCNSTVSGDYASVSGGCWHTVSGDYASVSGGDHNTASAAYASVSGGVGNTANGPYESIAGGDNVTCGSILNNYVCGEGSLTPID